MSKHGDARAADDKAPIDAAKVDDLLMLLHLAVLAKDAGKEKDAVGQLQAVGVEVSLSDKVWRVSKHPVTRAADDKTPILPIDAAKVDRLLMKRDLAKLAKDAGSADEATRELNAMGVEVSETDGM